MKTIAVINYHMGNLHSVAKALEYAASLSGCRICITNETDLILSSDAIVLPGVGAFGKGMENLKKIGIFDVLKKRIEEGVPFLGICLGLQLLFTESTEHGSFKGFGLVNGKVIRFPSSVKIPHMGWNQVQIKNKILNIKDNFDKSAETPEKKSNIGLFNGIKENSYFYFVHSYYVEPDNRDLVIATTDYGIEFASAINKDNIYGVQFHPEKSSALGLNIFSNFVKLINEV